MNDLELLMKVKNNSIGTDKKTKLITKTKSISKKTLVVLMLSLVTLSTCACNNTNYNFSRNHEIDSYRQSQFSILKYNLENNGMEFFQANNSIEEYKLIQDLLNEDNIIFYYDALGSEECNKILQVLGYNDLNDFLIKKGYINEKGEPSLEMFRMVKEERIINEMAERENESKNNNFR